MGTQPVYTRAFKTKLKSRINMDPAADWKPGKNPDQPPPYQDQPPPYQEYSAGYNPPPEVYPNQPAYGLNGQQNEDHLQPAFVGHQIITVQPTVFVTPGREREPDYLGCSIFTMLCCCIPLGIAALIYSIKATAHSKCCKAVLPSLTFSTSLFSQTRDANLTGNSQKAKRSSKTACVLNTTAVLIGIIVVILNSLRLFL
ncbi:hypothetical protein NFI96_018621 [Prochilodus magdalenae]|nr:hypothetical protein NFI96_018621 [Prochilodus magdalenae]